MEWIPILTDAPNISNDTKDEDSTTDTSSDSSEDEQGTENQGDFNDIDNFLETEVKEETFDDDIFRFVN